MKPKLIYKTLKSYIKVRLFNIPSPITIGINITNQCPKYCCYCDARNAEPKHMPIEKLLTLLNEIKKQGVARIAYNGGDPLMYPDFDLLIEETKRLGFNISVSTRETLVKKHIEALKKTDLVSLSFDGDEEAHNKHKGKDSFKDLIPAFEALKRHNIKFQTTTVLTDLNKNQIPYIAKTAKKYGFYAHFQPLQLPPFKKMDHSKLNESHPLSPLLLSKKDSENIGNELLTFKKAGFPVATSEVVIKLMFIDWPDPALCFLPNQISKIKCFAGLLYGNINEEGYYFPCGYYNPSWYPDCPNVFDIGFKNAVKKKINDGSCQSCLMPCFMEMNAMFSLDWKTIRNWWRII